MSIKDVKIIFAKTFKQKDFLYFYNGGLKKMKKHTNLKVIYIIIAFVSEMFLILGSVSFAESYKLIGPGAGIIALFVAIFGKMTLELRR